ncbi:MAG: hypothetical protein PVJ56_12425, partial [Desulfobacterales bacterium]
SVEWILYILVFIRQDKPDDQDYFFVFINSRKKLMKPNPPSVEKRHSGLPIFLYFISTPKKDVVTLSLL